MIFFSLINNFISLVEYFRLKDEVANYIIVFLNLTLIHKPNARVRDSSEKPTAKWNEMEF